MGEHAPVVSDDVDLVEAIIHDRAARWAAHVLADPRATPDRRARADFVRATCARIESATSLVGEHLIAALDAAEVPAGPVAVSDQRHALTLDVPAHSRRRATAVCEAAGYHRVRTWSGGAERSFWRVADEVLLTRSDDRTTAVRLRWKRSPTTPARRVLRPTPADWDVVELPAVVAWGYRFVRPVRLLLERTGLRSRRHAALEPFLVTPEDLLRPLLDAAELGPDDVVVDVGCGDGRIVVAAALTRGCRAIGVELDARSAAAAAERAERSGVSDRVQIINEDVSEVVLDDVTVAILFVPMVLAGGIVGDLLTRLPTGARIVLHEQGALADDLPPPHSSSAVVAAEAMSVAHRWIVGS